MRTTKSGGEQLREQRAKTTVVDSIPRQLLPRAVSIHRVLPSPVQIPARGILNIVPSVHQTSESTVRRDKSVDTWYWDCN